jgi:predicted DNA-binding transcriptional regulator AlpA
VSARTYDVEPRLLTKRQAAQFCGMSIPSFDRFCDVRPIQYGKRLKLYYSKDLTEWIERNRAVAASSDPESLLERLGRGGRSRERH